MMIDMAVRRATVQAFKPEVLVEKARVPEGFDPVAAEQEMADLFVHVDAAVHRLLTLIRAYEASGAWAGNRIRSFPHWLSWRYRLKPSAAERLREIHAPTLVVHGDRDVSDIHQIVARLAKEIPGAQKEVLAGAGHLVPMERPEDFNRLTLGFLAQRHSK